VKAITKRSKSPHRATATSPRPEGTAASARNSKLASGFERFLKEFECKSALLGSAEEQERKFLEAFLEEYDAVEQTGRESRGLHLIARGLQVPGSDAHAFFLTPGGPLVHPGGMKDGSRGSKRSETPGSIPACVRIPEGCQKTKPPRVVPAVQPLALLHNRVAVEAAHYSCSRPTSLARMGFAALSSSRRPNPTVSVLRSDESRFQRSEGSLADKPRALPWAGMNDAVGVSNGPASHFGLRTSLGLRAPPALSEFRRHRPGCGLLGFRISDFLRISGSAGRFGIPAAPA